MIQAASQPVFTTDVIDQPFRRVCRRRRIAAERTTLDRHVDSRRTARSDPLRWEDVLNLSLIGILGCVTIASYVWMAREFFEEFVKYNALDLLRGVGAM